MKKRTVFGLPLNPVHLLEQLRGRSFCVSYWTRGKLARQLDQAIELVGDDELLLIDNGAFSAWMSGQTMDDEYWNGFARWAADILARCPQAIVVVPDVIDGDADANDQLLHDFMGVDLELDIDLPPERMMPVWHMHEPIDRLLYLAEGFEYIGIGSSAQYAKCGTAEWHARIQEAFAAMDQFVAESNGAYRRPWLHMMRAQAQAHLYEFDSADSTNVAVNHGRYRHEGPGHVGRLADRVRSKIEASCSMQERPTIASPAAVLRECAEFDAKMRLLDISLGLVPATQQWRNAA